MNIFPRIWQEHRYEDFQTKAGKQLADDPLRKWANITMMSIAALSVLLFFYEELSVNPPAWLATANIVVDILFLADYLLRIIFSGLIREGSTQRMRWKFSVARDNYIYRWYGLVDLVAVGPPLLFHVANIGFAIGEFTRVARLLRLLRLARMLRIVKAFRFLRETLAAQKRLFAHHRKIGTEVKASLILVALIVTGGALLLHLLNEQSQYLGNVGDALYFSLLGLVGQGNLGDLPSFSERFVALGIVTCGLALLGIVTGTFTTLLMERVRMHTSGHRPYHGRGQLLICGYSHLLPEMLDLLAKANESRDVVMLFDRGRDHETFIEDNPHPCVKLGRPLAMHWLRGKSGESESLRNASAQNASHIILLSNETSSEESTSIDNNAQSLLALVQLRWVQEAKDDRHDGDVGKKIPVTLEYDGEMFTQHNTLSGEFDIDWVSKDAETSDALFQAIPDHVDDIFICGNNRSVPLLVKALSVKKPACNVSIAGDELSSKLVSQASCILLLADERMPGESASDAHTLQTFATIKSMGIRNNAVVIAQVFQESVGQWIQSNREFDQQCFAVRSDLSVARALLRNVIREIV